MKKPVLSRERLLLLLAISMLTGISSLFAVDLYVGSNSSGETTSITSGTNAYSNTYVGYTTNGNSNTLNVFNTNTLLTNSANLYIGYSGSSNSLVIANGAHVYSDEGHIGDQSTSSNNSVLVTGTNSLWRNTGTYVFIGLQGSSNSLVVSNGGEVDGVLGQIGDNASSSNNSVLITGPNSRWSNDSNFLFGASGSHNTLTISNGGIVNNAAGAIGDVSTSSNNTVLVTGTHSLWTNNNNLYIGNAGSSNSLTISNGGTVCSVIGYIGNQANSSNNLVLITGTNSLWSNSSTLYVGNSGNYGNRLIISNAAMVANGNAFVGGLTSFNNSVLVTGTNSLWSNNGNLYFGEQGSGNSLVISNGGVVKNSNAIIGDLDTSVDNTVVVTGANSFWSNSGFVYIGNNGNNSSLVISNQGTVKSSATIIGNSSSASNSMVLINGTNSTLNTTNLVIGQAREGVLVIANGGAVTGATNITIGALANSEGILNIGSYGGSDSAGTLETPLITFGAGTGTLNFNQTNSTTITNQIAGGSGVTVAQLGSGTTTLTQSNSYRGATIISRGTLIASNDFALGNSTNTTTINSNAILNAGGSSLVQSLVTMSNAVATNGALTNTAVHLLGGTNTLALNLTGSSSLTNSGGTNTISGTGNTYTGGTRISQGTLQTTSTNALGTGYVVIGGGTTAATLKLSNNLTAGSLTWSTNGYISLQPGSQTLTVLGILTNTNGGVFNLENVSLDNNTNQLIACTNIVGSTNFSDANIIGYSFMTNTAGLYGYISSNTTIVAETNVTQTNELTVGNFTLTNAATLTLSNNGRISATTNLTIASNSAVVVYLGSTSSTNPLLEGKTNVILQNPTLTLVFSGSVPFGNKYAIASGATITGDFSSISNNLPVGERLRLTELGDPVLYGVVAPTSYTEVAANQNQINVARALNSFISATGGDNQVVSTALDYLTAAEYPNAFQQISPALFCSFSTIAFNIANAQNNELVQRLGNIRVAGVGFDSMGLSISPIQDDSKNPKPNGKEILIPSVDNHWGIFTDASGIFANVNINNQLPGYSAESGGVTIGADYKWNETFSTGLYTGYQGVQSKQSGGNFICDNSYRFGLFGTYQQSGLFANAIIGGDSHSYQVNRTIIFPGINRTATSEPTAGELDSMLATGYDIKRGNFTFGPLTSLQYTYLGVQPFGENGAQSLNLNVAHENANSMIYSLGSHCFYTWQVNKDTIVVPQINLSWQHEFLQNPYAIDATLQGGGGSFNYMTTTPNRDSLYTGIGFTVGFTQKYNASFFYNTAAANTEVMSQNFFASIGMSF